MVVVDLSVGVNWDHSIDMAKFKLQFLLDYSTKLGATTLCLFRNHKQSYYTALYLKHS